MKKFKKKKNCLMKKTPSYFLWLSDFALPPLKTLYLGGYEIVGVYAKNQRKNHEA